MSTGRLSRRAAASYDVRIWNIRIYTGTKGRTYRVRWTVAGRAWQQTFKTRALAESFRAQLLSATRGGEGFDPATGQPVTRQSRTEREVTWYEHACAFVDMKWRRAAGKSRASIADALATVTPALLGSNQEAPRPKLMRNALYGWAFNSAQRRKGDPPDEIAKVIAWLERNTLLLREMEDPATLRRALDALATKQDGSPAAANTLMRKRAAVHNALEYAVELGLLESNPLPRVKWTAPKTTEAVDPRVLVDKKRAESLLVSVGEQEHMGPQLVAFFGCIFYAALRPGEVVQLRETDLVLPDKKNDWGELHLNASAPSVAGRWNDSGQRRERRQLKHRASKDVRIVPCHPRLVGLLHRHLDQFGTAPDGRLFRGKYYNRALSESIYGRYWQRAREKALTGSEVVSPLARRPYDLRHACVTTWLNAGVDPAQVAEWAGHSVAVLLRVYVRCIVGRDEIAKKRIERALEDENGRD